MRCTLTYAYDASLTYLPFLGVSSLINWPRRLNAGAAIFLIFVLNVEKPIEFHAPAPNCVAID